MTHRVALFSGNYNYVRDGANRALNRLVGYLEDEAGAQVRVYSPTTSTPAFAPTGTLVSVPSIPFPGRPDYRVALRFPSWLKQDLDAFRPTLIHLSAPDVLGYRALNFAEARDLPVVASLHTRFETYLRYYGLGWARALGERYLRSFYARCDRVLVPTPAILDEMRTILGDERVNLWSRGVDRDAFSPNRRDESWRRQHGIAPTDIVIAFFGRLVVEKGTGVFTRLAAILRGRGVPVRFLVIGDGPARQPMVDAIPDALFTGTLLDDALGQALASADIVINPSVTEAFGNVVLEAMASGLVAICADVASASNLITCGVDGILCDPDDPTAYADAVQALVFDRARLIDLGRAARRRTARFTWPDVMGGVVDVYDDVVLRQHDASRRNGGLRS